MMTVIHQNYNIITVIILVNLVNPPPALPLHTGALWGGDTQTALHSRGFYHGLWGIIAKGDSRGGFVGFRGSLKHESFLLLALHPPAARSGLSVSLFPACRLDSWLEKKRQRIFFLLSQTHSMC